MKNLISIALLMLAACSGSKTEAHSTHQEALQKTVETHLIDSFISLNEQFRERSTQGKIPIFYFYGNWCAPCRVFKASLTDKRVIKAFENAKLFEVNVDSDSHHLSVLYAVNAVQPILKLMKI